MLRELYFIPRDAMQAAINDEQWINFSKVDGGFNSFSDVECYGYYSIWLKDYSIFKIKKILLKILNQKIDET